MVVKVATFDILPTEALIQKSEEDIGITFEEYTLTDNFVDYGFDSTDPIRNLQVMFLFMLFLLFYPVFTLGLKLLFFWSSRCMRCRKNIDRKMYFNTYIRFTLEAYLELSITSLIRVRAFKFDDPSERFHSSFSVIIMIILASVLLLAAILPQKKFGELDKPKW